MLRTRQGRSPRQGPAHARLGGGPTARQGASTSARSCSSSRPRRRSTASSVSEPRSQAGGALTFGVYSTEEAVLAAAEATALDACVALSCNPTDGVYVNQSAAFSDFHGTGGNPAANAAFTNGSFVSGRFAVVQSRRHLDGGGKSLPRRVDPSRWPGHGRARCHHLRTPLSNGSAVGTKRVRQPGHGRARASTVKRVKQARIQGEPSRQCPRVDARPSLVFPT